VTLLLVACLAAAPADGGTPAPFAWDVPGLLDLVPVGQQLERDGLPMEVVLARSSWELDRLLLHYAGRFLDAGCFIPPKMGRLHGLKLPRVVALDPERLVSFLIYGWPEPDGTTTLVLGAANLKGRSARAGGVRLPVFPGASSPTVFDVEYATALSFVAKATEAEVIDFYREVLPADGWREREPGVFVKGGRMVRVLAKRQRGTLSIAVLEQADDGPGLPTPPR
jgi:hypothetical protein